MISPPRALTCFARKLLFDSRPFFFDQYGTNKQCAEPHTASSENGGGSSNGANIRETNCTSPADEFVVRIFTAYPVSRNASMLTVHWPRFSCSSSSTRRYGVNPSRPTPIKFMETSRPNASHSGGKTYFEGVRSDLACLHHARH